MKQILEKLRKNGHRITKPRMEILKLFTQHQGENLDAGEIITLLKKHGVEMDMATVYRNLELLFSLKIIHKSNFTHQHAHYGLTHQYEIHFICKECGSITELPLVENQNLLSMVKNLGDNFETESISIEIYGTCKRCRRS